MAESGGSEAETAVVVDAKHERGSLLPHRVEQLDHEVPRPRPSPFDHRVHHKAHLRRAFFRDQLRLDLRQFSGVGRVLGEEVGETFFETDADLAEGELAVGRLCKLQFPRRQRRPPIRTEGGNGLGEG